MALRFFIAPSARSRRRHTNNGLNDQLLTWKVPAGLKLLSFRLEGPDPGGWSATLRALEADVRIVPATTPALVATIDAPEGHVELR